jgi:hypothetical protein
MDFFRESPRLQLICEPPEFIEIDPWPESADGNRLRRGIASRRGGLTDAGANCGFTTSLEGMPSLPRTLLQQSSEIIVERQSRARAALLPPV